ncbi:hypothetical protein SD10_20780 [Spirosoma radiotolerans]|uniref:CHASE2 domain-containing protein n=1 Tax=Spirosoma radiotolerans TaxID=1379870 RepID=A0A0E3ZX66_9BACT|nr:hypothetical protein SD10_20780 [Spirosoma radiotolerans]
MSLRRQQLYLIYLSIKQSFVDKVTKINIWYVKCKWPFRLALKAFVLILGGLLLNESIFSKVNVSFLSPTQGFFDVQLSDYWVSFAHKSNNKSYKSPFTLVDITGLERTELANLLNLIAGYDPSVVGLDVFLERTGNKAENILLKQALLCQKQLVLAIRLTKTGKPIPLSPTFQDINTKGVTNFIALDSTSVIRFIPTGILKQNQYSFAAVIAAKYNPSTLIKYNKRLNDRERIYYAANLDYINVTAKQLLAITDTLSLKYWLKNRIVLLGNIGLEADSRLLQDIHFTPKNTTYVGRSFPDTYGTIIHLYAADALIRGEYFNESPYWLNLVLVFTGIVVSLLVDRHISSRFTDKPIVAELLLGLVTFFGLSMLAIGYLICYTWFKFVFDDDFFIKLIALSFLVDKVITKLITLLYNYINKN